MHASRRQGVHRNSGGKSADRDRRKREMLTHGSPAHTKSIADALVIKDRGLAFLCDRRGNVPIGGTHGFGLYYRDCRFLDGYELTVAGAQLETVAAVAPTGSAAHLVLINPRPASRGGARIAKEALTVQWERLADGRAVELRDRLTIRSHADHAVKIAVAIGFHAGFDDVFLVRGMTSAPRGHTFRPRWDRGTLSFLYSGVDDLWRSVKVMTRPAPTRTRGTSARFTIRLAPQEERVIEVRIHLAIDRHRETVETRPPRAEGFDSVEHALTNRAREWIETHTRFESDNPRLSRVVHRSLRDLGMLRTKYDREEFFAAGVPWFIALFGRDSLITAMQMMLFNARIARDTLRLLAALQGKRVDSWRDEEPGKILHEFRVGELANANVVPYTPYYGTVDATPLFLIALARYVRWTGDLDLARELAPHVDRALEWIRHYGDRDGDGYLEYQAETGGSALVNQGWKDSGNAIVDADGSIATPPIALVEVQGYAYRARLDTAWLVRLLGDDDRALVLEREARELRTHFNRDFWVPGLDFFALALHGHPKRAAAVLTSNPGQALWTGIVDPAKARTTADRLLGEDLFSGWGIRTLCTSAWRYNPLSYHLGSVWPHDNSLIAAGLRQYGFDRHAQRVMHGIFSAALDFGHARLPELFGGIAKCRIASAVRYPVANHPQAWGAGSVLLLLTTMLGLEPDAPARRLCIVRPMLPPGTRRIHLAGVRVGGADLDLLFERRGRRVHVTVPRMRGQLEVRLDGRHV